MKARRVGLVLATLLVVAALPFALDVHPNPHTGEVTLALTAAVISAVVAAGTLALLVPAWRGNRPASLVVAALQLGAISTALPAFFVADEFVPPLGVLSATVGSLLNVTALTLILLDSSATLLYAAAIVVVVSVYASLVAVVSAAVPQGADRSVQTFSAITVALLFEPVLRLLRRTVTRSIFGGRGDPVVTALQIGRRLGDGPDVVSAAVAETTRALRLARVEVLDRGHVLADAEAVRTHRRTALVPLDAERQLALRVTLRPGERRLHSGERAALELVALPLGLLIRQAQLVGDLRAARASAAQSRELERSLLHRDLHDGLGPLLTGAVLRSDAAHNLLPEQASAARIQVDLARSDLRTAIAEVRRVVYGLRPLELEQRGLWPAISRRCDGAGADLSLPDPPPQLSPAAELAVYRIITEALTNVERHAPGAATTVEVDVSDGEVEIEVANAGSPPPDFTEGVGLTSVRARTEELGGRAVIGPVAGGWRVRVRLPLT